MENKAKLIFKSKEYIIPSDLSDLSNVNEEVIKSLTNNYQYEVKSDITENVFNGFIQHLFDKKLPDISPSNLEEYEQISKEFGIDLLSLNKKETSEACKDEDFKFSETLTREKCEQDGLSFILDETTKGASVYQDLGTHDTIVIPRSIKFKGQEYIVKKILENAFSDSPNIKKIFIPDDSEIEIFENYSFSNTDIDSITIPIHTKSLGKHCFSNCKKLTTITFPEGCKLENIDEYAFSSSSIKEIVIPKSVTKISNYTFALCNNLKSVSFEKCSKIQIIKKESFLYSSIEKLNLPSSVDCLQNEWSNGAIKLNKINIFENNDKKNIKLYEKTLIIGLTGLQKNSLLFCVKNIVNVVIPDFVINIEAGAFNECRQLRSIIFTRKSKIQSIGKNAFSNSSIREIVLPSTVRNLDAGCFNGTNKLINITILKNKEENIIYYENNFILGKSDINSDFFDVLHFARRNIKKATIPSFIKYISEGAFNDCRQLNNVEFDDKSKLKIIGKKAFSYTSIQSISIPSSVTSIGDLSFMNCCELKKLECSKDSQLQSIGEYAFSYSSISSLTIPSSVSEFKDGWRNETSLNKITILKSENEEKNLIKLYDNSFIIGKSSLSGEFDTLLCSVHNTQKVTIPSFIKKIEKFAFYECEKLETVDFAGNSQLQSIGEYAFSYSAIRSIILPKNVSHIGNHAFYECQNLYFVDLSENVGLISFDKNIFEESPVTSMMLPQRFRNKKKI